jgi:hypothetical protein
VLLVHANVGRDFRRGNPDSSRAGVSVEWAPAADWSLVAERFRESNTNFWRVGARYLLSAGLSIDLSRAGGMNGASLPWWTLGVNHSFAW